MATVGVALSAAMGTRIPIQSTAGAVPIRNEKGQITMQKVKVTRYVAGKKPEFAAGSSSDSESDVDDDRHHLPPKMKQSAEAAVKKELPEIAAEEDDDPRWRRLHQPKKSEDDSASDDNAEKRVRRHRRLQQPQILKQDEDDDRSSGADERVLSSIKAPLPGAVSSSDEDEEMDDEELARRRALVRQRAKQKQEEELLAAQEEEGSGSSASGSEAESSEYEEYSDSDDDAGPRLKPVFVRKRDRITLQDNELAAEHAKQLAADHKRQHDERKRQSVKIVEELVRQELQAQAKKNEEQFEKLNLDSVVTDEENEQLAYEQWKLRELKRIKRDRDERELKEKEKQEIDRIHSMTEEERRAYLRANPKLVTNKQIKGKYKFLQKYFHRGAYYLEKDDDVYKRDFAQPTLEDHFDKTVLPKVMQVKNFGLAGRTKYTHLVDQDTTDFNSAWATDTAHNIKFHAKHAGGMKDVFERPTVKKRKA